MGAETLGSNYFSQAVGSLITGLGADRVTNQAVIRNVSQGSVASRGASVGGYTAKMKGNVLFGLSWIGLLTWAAGLFVAWKFVLPMVKRLLTGRRRASPRRYAQLARARAARRRKRTTRRAI